MTIRPIRYLGDPVLRLPTRRVRRVNSDIQLLVTDMIESMYATNGVGLAAPQIGISLKLVVIGMPDENPFALINPEITKREGTRVISEGCLSVPGYSGSVTRSERVTVRALSAKGERVHITAENDLLAQALEHETDHVNGLLYVDHLNVASDIRYMHPRGDDQLGDEDMEELDDNLVEKPNKV
ncbi:MAG: peptide deformylase [Chloroflexota bacterium]|nr:peptide deformylase [Chloroflexota bacterium]